MHRFRLVEYENAVHAWGLDLVGVVSWGRDVEEMDARLRLVIAEQRVAIMGRAYDGRGRIA